jgi:ceramide glucosyltransferase
MTVILLALCATALISYGCSALISLSFFARPLAADGFSEPPVSILKPVCGLDRGAYENWASFCRQDYPTYQIIFGVSDPQDPAIAVVRRLIRDFPEVDVRLVIDSHTIGSNLKVSNLANLEPYARHQLILMSDSDIRVTQDYLHSIVQPLQNPQVGVVTCLYRSHVYSFIAALEALSISTDFHATVLLARQLGWMKFAMGSSILIRRVALEKMGGFGAIADHLADDFMLGNLTVQSGFSVELSSYVVSHTLETRTLIDLIQHQTRWNRCTRAANPLGYFGLIFGHGTTFSLVFLCLSKGSSLGWTVLAVTWTVRLLMGWIVGVRGLQDVVAARFFWLIPLRDLLSFALWCYGLIGDRVVWRGKQFRLISGGKLEPLQATVPEGRVGKLERSIRQPTG